VPEPPPWKGKEEIFRNAIRAAKDLHPDGVGEVEEYVRLVQRLAGVSMEETTRKRVIQWREDELRRRHRKQVPERIPATSGRSELKSIQDLRHDFVTARANDDLPLLRSSYLRAEAMAIDLNLGGKLPPALVPPHGLGSSLNAKRWGQVELDHADGWLARLAHWDRMGRPMPTSTTLTSEEVRQATEWEKASVDESEFDEPHSE